VQRASIETQKESAVGIKAHTNKGMILVLACAAQFMVVLDVAVVNVALPSIQHDLGIGKGTLQWIIIAYGLMLGGFLLLGGRMADLLGRRRMLLTGLTLFSSASLLAGVAGSAGLLIGARALQGFGAALIPPAALSILAVTFAEGAERNRALGLYGAVTGVSGSVGVLASGLLTQGAGWHWVFRINVPIGVLLIAMAAVFLPVDAGRRHQSERFDVAGAVTVTAGLLLLVYALNHGADHGWGSGSTLGLFAASVVLLSAFVQIEARSRSPLVPGSAVRNRTLVAANLSAFFTFGAFFAFIFLGSLLMQQVLGYSPTRTGVAWLATTATSVVAAGITGKQARRGGGRAAPAHRGPGTPRDLRPVADAGSGWRGLRNRPAAGAAPGRRGGGNGCSGRTDRRSVRCHALDDRPGVRARRNHARDRGRRRRGCRVDGPRIAGRGERFPRRVLGAIRGRSPGRADGRDWLPAAHSARTPA
jgi:MFS family permease